jgi:hypothetical protein
MLNLSSWLAMHHWTRLGRCPACMRTAFLFASGSSALLLAAWSMGLSGISLLMASFAAGALVSLWLGHVFMFSRHAVRSRAVRRGEASGGVISRRAALLVFLKLLLVTAAVTSLPRSLRAQGCNCYSDSDCYCPPDYPQCVFNPSTGEAVCCGPNTVGCAGPNLTWCCPPGSQCYGNDGQCMASQ